MNALLFFHPLFARRRGAFVLALALSALTLVFGLSLLGLSGWFLTAASLTSLGAVFNLFGPSSAVRGLSFLRILSRYGEKLVGHDATLGTLTDIRQWLLRALMPRIGRVRRDMRHGDLVSRLTADVDALDVAFLVGIGPMATGIAVGAGVTVLLALLLPGAALVYGASMAMATLAVPLLLARATRRLGAEAIGAAARLRGLGLDAVEGRGDLVALGAVNDAKAEFREAAARLGAIRQRLAARAALAIGAIHLLSGAALVGTLLAGAPALAEGRIGGPLLVGLVLAVLGSFEASAGTVRGVAGLGASIAAAERLRGLATTAPTTLAPLAPRPLEGARTIDLAGVGFAFCKGRFVLKGVTLSVLPGECVVVKGPSGAGKSALLSLLMRLEDPTEGSVRIGRRDLRQVAPKEIGRHVALLEQGAPVFLGTIADNLRIADPRADEERLFAALDAARLGDAVRAMPGGLATFVGEGGRSLSAGQARRLCLARALLSPARILLLDEPTSGLDRATERAFFADLKSAAAGRTILVATHAEIPPGLADRSFSLRAGRLEAIA